ncbi:hypothetical protein ABFT51_09110 [Paenibacillus peoriae]|uniref:hypothetical protein n=1 Tax=Paenibacillus peoriae TaxID=59893 RepID=UPI0032AF4A5A
MLFEDNCHFQKTGQCSLTLTENEVTELADLEKYNGKNSVNYCRNLYISLNESGQLEDIELTRYKCGHYAFTDGQHRACVSKLAKMDLNAHIDFEDSFCNKCLNPNIDAVLY